MSQRTRPQYLRLRITDPRGQSARDYTIDRNDQPAYMAMLYLQDRLLASGCITETVEVFGVCKALLDGHRRELFAACHE